MKKILSLAAIALFMMTSCSGDDDNGSTNTAATLIKKTVSTYDDGYEVTTDFSYNGNKITSITDSEGNETQYVYNGNLISEIKTYEDDVFFQKDVFEYDNNNKLIVHTMYLLTQDYARRAEFVYNGDNTITVSNYSGDLESQTMLSGTDVITVIADNITQVVNGSTILTSEFDDKTDPLSNITGYEALLLSSMEGGVNNVTSYTRTTAGNVEEHYTYVFTYNSNNYPVSSVETDEETGEVVSTEIFY